MYLSITLYPVAYYLIFAPLTNVAATISLHLYQLRALQLGQFFRDLRRLVAAQLSIPEEF